MGDAVFHVRMPGTPSTGVSVWPSAAIMPTPFVPSGGLRNSIPAPAVNCRSPAFFGF